MDDRSHDSVWTYLRDIAFKQSYIDVDGVRTRCIEAGDPTHPAVVMLHGTAGSWETFCKNIGPHAQKFRVVALDMIGNGFSDKPDFDYEIFRYVEHLRALLGKLGIQKASIVGVSLGAWVAARFAREHPDMTERITLVAPSGLIANPETMKRIRAQRSSAADAPTWENVRAIFNNLLHRPEDILDDLVSVRLAAYRLPAAKVGMSRILCLQDFDIRTRNLLSEADWQSIQVPALVVAAADHEDDYLTTARRLCSLMPRVKFVQMHGVNHWAHYEDPEVFNAVNIAFLQGAP